MRDIYRIPVVLNRLQEVWTCYPDLRFGQLIENIIVSNIGIGPEQNNRVETALWNWEEDKWTEAIINFAKRSEKNEKV